jgi:hypothetical protein
MDFSSPDGEGAADNKTQGPTQPFPDPSLSPYDKLAVVRQRERFRQEKPIERESGKSNGERWRWHPAHMRSASTDCPQPQKRRRASAAWLPPFRGGGRRRLWLPRVTRMCQVESVYLTSVLAKTSCIPSLDRKGTSFQNIWHLASDHCPCVTCYGHSCSCSSGWQLTAELLAARPRPRPGPRRGQPIFCSAGICAEAKAKYCPA